MSEKNDLPEGTVPDEALSFDEGVTGISDLLDPEMDLKEEKEAKPDEDEDGSDEPDEAVDDDTVEAEDDEADEDASEDDDETQDEEEEYDIDDELVTMADGREITVRELREYSDNRIKEFQSDYTQKQQALSQERQNFEAERQHVNATAQALQEHRDLLMLAYERIQPQAPDPAMMQSDPLGYFEAKELYEGQMREWTGLEQQAQAIRQQQEAQSKLQTQQFLQQEQARMLEIEPKLKDATYLTEFAQNANEFLSSSGAPEGAISLMDAAWQLDILRKAMAYDKMAKAAPKAKQKLEGKPKVLKGRKRRSSREARSRTQQLKSDRLRKTGSLEAGVDALMDLDL